MTQYLVWYKDDGEETPHIIEAKDENGAKRVEALEVGLSDDFTYTYLATEFWIQIFAPTEEEQDYRSETGGYLNSTTRTQVGERVLAYFDGNSDWADKFLAVYDWSNENDLPFEDCKNLYRELPEEMLLYIWDREFEDYWEYAGIMPIDDLEYYCE